MAAYIKRYAVRISRWSQTKTGKAGKKLKYYYYVLRFPRESEPQLKDFVGKDLLMRIEGDKIVIERKGEKTATS